MHVPDITTSKTVVTVKSLQQIFINFQYCSLKTRERRVRPLEVADFFFTGKELFLLGKTLNTSCLLTPTNASSHPTFQDRFFFSAEPVIKCELKSTRQASLEKTDTFTLVKATAHGFLQICLCNHITRGVCETGH